MTNGLGFALEMAEIEAVLSTQTSKNPGFSARVCLIIHSESCHRFQDVFSTEAA